MPAPTGDATGGRALAPGSLLSSTPYFLSSSRACSCLSHTDSLLKELGHNVDISVADHRSRCTISMVRIAGQDNWATNISRISYDHAGL